MEAVHLFISFFPEWNYSIYDKELLAIIRALEEWCHYLIGKTNFEIWTDYKNPEYWKKPQTFSDC